MTDAKTLAYINMFAVLGTLENLCAEDPQAASLADLKRPLSVAFTVKGGPSATFTFAGGKCTVREGLHPCQIKLPFSSCEKFNGLIAGTVTPIPSKGFTHIKFLTKNFARMTDILSRYLKATPEDLKDPAFFEKSTRLMFYTIASAISQIGNHDKIGRFSASNIVDGTVMLSIKGGPKAGITISDHKMHTVKSEPEQPRAIMEFADITLARKLFDGAVNSFACVGNGQIEIKGMISMVDNVNRILDRVAVYLA